MKYLVLVESPAKIQKIQKILNESNDGNKYHVAATVGHILSLNSEKTLGVDLGDNYKPDYVPQKDKREVIANIRNLAKGVDQGIIASDLDQEGEFIGYSICHVLKLPLTSTPRIIFNEITKSAILQAVKNHKTLDFNLLDAQKCRRVSDRLIGFLITRAAKSINPKLTVGRVQTIMVKLVIDREKEMENFTKTLSYHTVGHFTEPTSKKPIESKLNSTFKSHDEANEFLIICAKSGTTFPVESINKRTVSKSPPPPLITSTLQSLVSRSLGISPKEAMDTAQKLYQEGLISYPRTDCPKLPEEKMDECARWIKTKFGDDYYQKRVFKSNDKSAQEAHACIYPTKVEMEELPENGDFPYSLRMRRVYRFVWLYAVSSQMSPSQTEVTRATIGIVPKDKNEQQKVKFIAENSKLIFEGYQRVWGKIAAASEDDDENADPNEDETTNESRNSAILDLDPVNSPILDPIEVQAKQKAAQGPAPYTESSLITQMKRYGVGRPSTYGGILSQVMDESKKGFIYKASKPGEKLDIEILTWKPAKHLTNVACDTIRITQNSYRNRIYSTELGRAIDNFVNEYFPDIFNYGFTRKLEGEMNDIESGQAKWSDVVDRVYKAFAPKLGQFPRWGTGDNVESNPARKPKRQIGTRDDKPVYAYLGKFGAVIQIGDDGPPKPQYITLPKEFNIETVTLPEIEYLFGFPYDLGKLEESDGRSVMLKKSKFGLYLDCRDGKVKGKTYQVTADMFDPDTFDETMPFDQQIPSLKLSLVQDHIREADAPKECLRQIQDIRIVRGKFGPYFIFNGVIVGIPKYHNVDLITYDECLQLYQSKCSKGGKKYKKKETSEVPKKKITLKKKLTSF